MTKSQLQHKARVNLSIQKDVKEKVQDKLKNSSLNMSDLAEEAFKEFLRSQDRYNPDAVYDKVEELQCGECEGILTGAVLSKTGGECPGCGNDIRG